MSTLPMQESNQRSNPNLHIIPATRRGIEPRSKDRQSFVLTVKLPSVYYIVHHGMDRCKSLTIDDGLVCCIRFRTIAIWPGTTINVQSVFWLNIIPIHC